MMLRLMLPTILMTSVLLLPMMLILVRALVWRVAVAMAVAEAVGRIRKSHHRAAAAHCPIVPLAVLPLRSGLMVIRARSVSIALVVVAALVAMRRTLLSELQWGGATAAQGRNGANEEYCQYLCTARS